MRLIPCQSSSLAGIAYEPGSTRFYAQFKDGSVYEYIGGQLTPEIVTDILFAESQGRVFKNAVQYLAYVKVESPEELDLHV